MSKFSELLSEAGKQYNRLVLFIDGLDHFDDDIHHAQTLEWIPDLIPQVSYSYTQTLDSEYWILFLM